MPFQVRCPNPKAEYYCVFLKKDNLCLVLTFKANHEDLVSLRRTKGTLGRHHLVLARQDTCLPLGILLEMDFFFKCSHMPLHVKSQVVRARESTLAQVTLERPVSGVLPEMAGQLV